jgi:hypothetical protein
MKREEVMKRSIRITLLASGLMLLSMLLLSVVMAQNSPIKINLVSSQATYQEDEPVKMQVNVYNNSGEEAIIPEDFMNQDFYLLMKFTAPDGTEIRSRPVVGGEEPGPPDGDPGRDCTLIDIIPSGDGDFKPIPDARQYYDLSQYGHWTAELEVALTTFSRVETDLDRNLVGCIDDPGIQIFNPLAANKVSFDIVPPDPGVRSDIHAQVTALHVGKGSRPDVKKEPLENVPVRLYLMSDIRDVLYSDDSKESDDSDNNDDSDTDDGSRFSRINWKVYSVIWNEVAPLRTSLTDAEGLAVFEEVLQGDYLLLGLYEEAQHFRFMGRRVTSDDDRWGTDRPIRKHMRVIIQTKKNGKKKKCPGKVTWRKGSELIITEPEYVLWDDTEEVYPFVFETEGDWEVNTSVAPPEGFVADNESIDTEVADETKAVQFTMTDIGSRWEETGVTLKVKHDGKTEIIKRKIGVKLSRRLAKEKGLSIYGHTKAPGPFKWDKTKKHKKDKKKSGVKK